MKRQKGGSFNLAIGLLLVALITIFAVGYLLGYNGTSNNVKGEATNVRFL